MEQSSFFNSVAGDRQYDMEQFALYFKQFLSNGIYHRDNVPALLVSKATALQTTLDSGSAYIEGFMYLNTTSKSFTHDAADATNPRIDRIVLKLDRSVNVRSINAVVKKGVPATNPLPPALERNDVIYEISLSQVRINANSTVITSVTDERFNTAVAGLVSSLISIPTDSFIQDWNAFTAEMDQNMIDYEQQWQDWFNGIQVQNPAMGGMTIYVSSTQPSTPALNDIWIDIDG